jgi:murein DD-endopeptidase MepM/ murein hydrolase activator NlpD
MSSPAHRLFTPIAVFFLTILACSSPNPASTGGHVTPFGTQPATLTPTLFVPTDSPTLTPTATRPFTPLPPISPNDRLAYRVQTGDTLDLLAQRFSVPLDEILKLNNLSAGDVLVVDDFIFIPARFDQTGPGFKILPDSELVYSLGVAGFDVDAFVAEQGGYLARHREFVRGATRSGAEVVLIAALDHSVSPRLLLAPLEYQSGWVTDPAVPEDKTFPIYHNPQRQGLFNQLDWLADTLNLGYYRWRDGSLSAIDFPDGVQIRIAPTLNAGTVSLQYGLSRLYTEGDWQFAVSAEGVAATYQQLFGDPFEKAVEPIVPNDLTQPELRLPFDDTWSFIGGPHAAWEPGSPWAALDFAPPSSGTGCLPSNQWVLAPAAGLVVRSGDGVVVIDLDGDGREQSGWSIMLLHIATTGRILNGTSVEAGDPIGHPSCEGGRSTGTHVHLARKFNGEWIPVEGHIPFDLSGWVAHTGVREYRGTLTKGDDTVTACECSADVSGISIGR